MFAPYIYHGPELAPIFRVLEMILTQFFVFVEVEHHRQCKRRFVIVFVKLTFYRQVAQLSQRDCAAGCVSFGQKWKTGMGRQYFADIVSLSSTNVT